MTEHMFVKIGVERLVIERGEGKLLELPLLFRGIPDPQDLLFFCRWYNTPSKIL
ncbi:hypothetical protein M758_UG312500 [Ceratodon purpureus]|nr:hypothetical protein M758_UG312500 [Ceratodon purpureus]